MFFIKIISVASMRFPLLSLKTYSLSLKQTNKKRLFIFKLNSVQVYMLKISNNLFTGDFSPFKVSKDE